MSSVLHIVISSCYYSTSCIILKHIVFDFYIIIKIIHAIQIMMALMANFFVSSLLPQQIAWHISHSAFLLLVWQNYFMLIFIHYFSFKSTLSSRTFDTSHITTPTYDAITSYYLHKKDSTYCSKVILMMYNWHTLLCSVNAPCN